MARVFSDRSPKYNNLGMDCCTTVMKLNGLGTNRTTVAGMRAGAQPDVATFRTSDGFSGSRKICRDSTLLGRMKLRGFTPMPATQLRVSESGGDELTLFLVRHANDNESVDGCHEQVAGGYADRSRPTTAGTGRLARSAIP